MKDFDFNDFDLADTEFDDRSVEELYEEFLGTREPAKGEFIYYYGGYFNVMKELTGSSMLLLTWLTFNCEVNTGRVVVQSFAQKEAMKELGINTATYYNSLRQLKNLDIIRGTNAIYYVNPNCAWKGTADKRTRFLKLYPRM